MDKSNTCMKQEGVSFLRHELAAYRRHSNLLPVLAAISQIALSVVLMILPKIVLDVVHNFMWKIILAGAFALVLTLANMFFRNEITKVSQTFLYRRLNTLWEKKMLSMNFEAFSSGEGKIKIEKARQLIDSPNYGIVDLLNKETAVLEAVLGLAVYSFVVGKLHILMLLFLCILFIAELLAGLEIEKRKESHKEERARADRRINYLAYGTKGMKEAKDIRIYSMLPMLREITSMVVRDKRKVETDIQRWRLCHMLITAGMIFLRDSVGYLFLIHQFLYTGMSIGNFALYFTAISGIGMWLTRIADAFSGYKEVSGYAGDFYAFLEMPEDEGEGEEHTSETPVSFTFQNVHYSYHIPGGEGGQKIPVIKGLNLSVRAGEKIAIVGPNGAGKSTLIKLICGMLTPDQGTIFVNGRDVSLMRKRAYYSLFSAVFQSSRLLPVSIADNIMLRTKGRDKDRMWEVLEKVGLERKVKNLPQGEYTCLGKNVTHGAELSGGQEQRLLLARALYKDAPVLILDEPTAALDPISESEIYQKYNALTQGKTSFFVSHRLASTRFCDRILFLENGEVTEMGSHGELMEQNGAYADMFRVQSKYYA